MFIQRAIVTFTLLPVALYVIYRGEWAYFLPITLVLLVATVEYARLARELGWQLPLWILMPAVLIFWVSGQWPRLETQLTPLLVVALLGALLYVLVLYERHRSQTAPADWLAMMGGIFLLGWVGSHFFRLRGLPHMAWQWTMLTMLGTWMADSAAFVVGKYMAGTVFGKHKLSPRLSPNKTIEGYLGGVVFGTSITIIVAGAIHFSPPIALILGLLVSIISPIGDLGISLLKREAGVKDSGALFLKHGGALDRTDSLIWSVTMAYYLALFIN
jgi:phosphatidate cytidylyltransferase